MALYLKKFQSINDKPAWRDVFDPRTQTLVVADLKSKLAIQRIYLQTERVLEEDAILRANEFWRRLLVRLKPEVRIISPQLASTMIQRWLKAYPEGWIQSPGTVRQVSQYILQLLPLLSHSEGHELMSEWFHHRPQSLVRWGQWYYLAREIWQKFNEMQVIAPQWVPALLMENDFSSVWSRPLIFDLGAELTGVEAELIQSLSQQHDVTVFKPDPDWKGDYYSSLWAYDLFDMESSPRGSRAFARNENSDRVIDPMTDGRSQDMSGFSHQNISSRKATVPYHNVQFRKFTTMASEVKDCTAQVRAWLDEGMTPNKIAICAPDIEVYWSALKAYFEVEGIAVLKDVVTPATGLPTVMAWLSRLRIQSGELGSHHLEQSLFSAQVRPLIDYETFERLFTFVYHEEDLKRHPKMVGLFQKKLPSNHILTRDEFAVWSLSHWPGGDSHETVDFLFQRLLQDCPVGMTMPLEQWLFYFEGLISATEFKLEPAPTHGVHFVNLLSAENLNVERIYFLGLIESALRRSETSAITLEEILDLSRSFGVYLNHPDKTQLEFAARWLLTDQFRTTVASVAETDFSGDVQAPSLVWLQGKIHRGENSEEVNRPGDSRWDQLQRASIQTIALERGWELDLALRKEKSILFDIGLEKRHGFRPPPDLRLSITQIENYKSCPFIFAARRLFRLSDQPELDLDLDRANQGKLMHALFEQLSTEPMNFSLSDEQLQEIVEQCRTRVELQVGDERIWPRWREKYIRLAKRFLEFEREWRSQFAATQTVARELEWKASWDREQKMFRPEGEGDILFSGRIDRVDSNGEGQYVLIDYKSSGNKLRQFGGWIKEGQYQLGVYADLVNSGLTPLPPGEVIGAVYYVSRTLNREKGFYVSDKGESLFPLKNRLQNKIKSKDLPSLFASLREEIANLIEAIMAGDFSPRPEDIKNCNRCHWRTLCRATHLN